MGRTLSASSSYIAPLPKVTVTIRWNSFTVTIRYGDSVPSAIISISQGRGSYIVADRSNQIGGARSRMETTKSIGICYEGGLDEQGRPADTRTYAQRCTLMDLLRQLRRDYPEARILGHYQLSPYIRKACPCFDAREEYGEI